MRAKGCSPRSLADLTSEQARHLSDWLHRPLSSLSRHEVASRHERLSDDAGPYVANRVLQQFRAVYNTALRRFEDLPQTNPTIAVTSTASAAAASRSPGPSSPPGAARSRPCQTPSAATSSACSCSRACAVTTRAPCAGSTSTSWRARSTCRAPRAASTARSRSPSPAACARLLLTRRARNPYDLDADDLGWVFPTRRRSGEVTHVIVAKEQRRIDGRKVARLPSPHRLRDTFATAAHECRVHPLDLKVLMNHALPAADDVTQGYIRPSLEHLGGVVGEIAGFLEERLV